MSSAGTVCIPETPFGEQARWTRLPPPSGPSPVGGCSQPRTLACEALACTPAVPRGEKKKESRRNAKSRCLFVCTDATINFQRETKKRQPAPKLETNTVGSLSLSPLPPAAPPPSTTSDTHIRRHLHDQDTNANEALAKSPQQHNHHHQQQYNTNIISSTNNTTKTNNLQHHRLRRP